MQLTFTKMQGAGNDFVVFNAINQSVELTPEQLRQIADRHFGIGCDQILLVEKPRSPDTDFYYRIFNADGGEVEQCGNGARCFARYVNEKGLSSKRELHVGTATGDIILYQEKNNLVRVNMGAPRFSPAEIPFQADTQKNAYTLDVEEATYSVGVVSMGNPHVVLQVSDVATAPVEKLGPLIQAHVRFPQRVNVGFMQIQSRNEINLRVFERGSGETLACGTGACAAVVSGIQQKLLNNSVTVHVRGGQLIIRWSGEENEPVWMSGPAETVFEGNIEL